MSSCTLRFVTGKGGVGKTTVACAIAWRLAQQGQKVLLAEINGGGLVASSFNIDTSPHQIYEIAPNLHAVDITPQDALREYALLRLRLKILYKTVFENRLVQHFLRLLPALGEYVILGKLWHHAQEKQNGQSKYNSIVVDAPATGHALSLLRTPETIFSTIPRGPLHDYALEFQELLRAQSTLHVVTTAEEMPVNEALLLLSSAKTIGITIGETFANQIAQPLPDTVWQKMASLRQNAEWAALWGQLKTRDEKIVRSQHQLENLKQHPNCHLVFFPLLVDTPSTAALIKSLAQQLSFLGKPT